MPDPGDPGATGAAGDADDPLHIPWLITLAAVAAIVIIGLPVVAALATSRDGRSTCPPGTTVGIPPAPATVDKPGVLKLREDQKAGIVFDRSVSLKRRQLQYDYSDGSVHLEQGTLLASELSDFESDNSSLDPAMMSVQTRYSAGHVSLTLCVTRNGPDDLGPPGQYKGIVSITDPRVSRVDLPFTIDMSYPAWPLVLDAVVLADLAGILWVWLIRQSSSGSTKVPGRNFCSWLSGAGGTAALAVGCAAGVGVWVQTYLSDSSWGTSFAAWISLVGAAFTACVAAAGAPVVIGRGQK